MPVCHKQHIIPAITTSERSLASRRADFLMLSPAVSSPQPNTVLLRSRSPLLPCCPPLGRKEGQEKLLRVPELSIGASPVTSTPSAGLDSLGWAVGREGGFVQNNLNQSCERRQEIAESIDQPLPRCKINSI